MAKSILGLFLFTIVLLGYALLAVHYLDNIAFIIVTTILFVVVIALDKKYGLPRKLRNKG